MIVEQVLYAYELEKFYKICLVNLEQNMYTYTKTGMGQNIFWTYIRVHAWYKINK
jgi:hypothetical protein